MIKRPSFGAFSIFVSLLLLSSSARAHIEMLNPLPIASKYDPENSEGQIDYSNTRPLSVSGSDFPCLGHLKDPSHVTATYQAGQTYPLELTGSATHGGGSCQVSLSYDNGATFRVIKSMIGNCPIPLKYQFTVPSSAPAASDALLAWTWFNKVGNREMYMNCAHVTIQSGAVRHRQRHIKHPARFNASVGLDPSFPEIFKANIFGGTPQETCRTVEGSEVVFPNPGPDVEYGDPSLKNAPSTNFPGCPESNGAASNGTNSTVPAPSGPVSSSARPSVGTPLHRIAHSRTPHYLSHSSSSNMIDAWSSITALSVTTSLNPARSHSLEKDTPNAEDENSSAILATAPTTLAPSVASDTSSAPTPTPVGDSCGEGTIQCSSTGDAWSLCAHGTFMSMGPVAAGTICRNGEIARKSDNSTCEYGDEGKIKCVDEGRSWSVCAGGILIGMGSVAEGTSCIGEQIVASS